MSVCILTVIETLTTQQSPNKTQAALQQAEQQVTKTFGMQNLPQNLRLNIDYHYGSWCKIVT